MCERVLPLAIAGQRTPASQIHPPKSHPNPPSENPLNKILSKKFPDQSVTRIALIDAKLFRFELAIIREIRVSVLSSPPVEPKFRIRVDSCAFVVKPPFPDQSPPVRFFEPLVLFRGQSLQTAIGALIAGCGS